MSNRVCSIKHRAHADLDSRCTIYKESIIADFVNNVGSSVSWLGDNISVSCEKVGKR
jgi:hypothetical protein